ncbi:MAG: hypothetical protein AB7Q29_09330 [Vicinamibacterales bacterium]
MNGSTTEQFLEDGVTVVRGLLEADESAFYVERLKRAAGGATRWTQPDGVNRNPDFWPIIFNERLLAIVREILGPDVKYLPHNDLHLGFSSFSWHRDSVSRGSTDGSDWDEAREPYRLVRVGLYLQRFEDSRFRFGVVKGSHRPSGLSPARRQKLQRRTGAAANVLSGLSGADLVGGEAEWIATEPGDCVIFDPRLLHTGSRFHGEKYSVFVAYGVENAHFRRHWHYYRRLRSDLGYSSIPPALVDRLKAAGLLAVEPPDDMAIEDAWMPSAAYTYVAKRFK